MYEAAILGAGPAGSAAARLLATWSHRVVLLHRPERSPGRAESIPPSCRKLFAACGVADAIEAAGFYRSTGNTVWWGADEPRREHFAHGASGYQVDRNRFDALMRRAAVTAGAELRERVARNVESERDGARLEMEGADESAIRARFVLDCTGRAGLVARRGWRTDIKARPRTFALNGVWTSGGGWPDLDPSHTLVESYADGWAWSVPLSPHLRHVAVMVDPQRTNLARGRPASEVYAAELGKTRHLASLTRDSVSAGAPWGCDASVYSATTFAADPMLLVGDAGSFIDPLSSYGIKKALASAWLAAVAVHTSLRTPSMTSIALAFHAAREETMAASMLRQQRSQFEDAATAHAHPFWTDRAADDDFPADTEPDTRALRDDGRVQQAFAWLKAQHSLRLTPGATMQRKQHPIVRGHEIVLEDRLVSESCADGLRFLRDVDLVGLLELAPGHDQVPALFEAYNRRFPPVSLPDFLGTLSVMIAFGFLEVPG